MKKIFFVVYLILLSSYVFSNPIGEIRMVKGDVVFLEKEAKVEIGDEVNNNSVIETKNDSEVELDIFDQGTIVIKSNSKFYLNQIVNHHEKESSLFVNLIKGFMKVIVNKKTDKHFFCTTHTVTAGVRGTEFTFVSSPTGSAYVEVTEGVVSVCDRENLNDDYDIDDGIDITKGYYFEKNLESAPVIKEAMKKHVERENWFLEKLAVDKTEFTSKLSRFELHINSLESRLNMSIREIDTITELKQQVNRSYGFLLGKLRNNKYANVNKSSKLYKNMEESVSNLNQRRLEFLNKYRFLLDEYYTYIESYGELLDYIEDNSVLVESEFNVYSEKYNGYKGKMNLFHEINNSWVEMANDYSIDSMVF